MGASPTTIITGFLGSGKTTFLNHILTKNKDTRYAIIENEYGKKSIDSDLIMRSGDDIVELNNGCLCCTLNESLYEILNQLYNRRDQYDELIIEATGVADPRGLAAPFLTYPNIKKQFPLTRIICLVDAALIEEHLANTEEAIHQITFSDVILINKVDLVDADKLDVLTAKMQELNPLATIVHGSENEFPEIDAQKDLEELLVQQSLTPHHKHTEGLKSFTFTFDEPFDYQKLHFRLLTFLMFQSKGLYRIKGIISVTNSDEKYKLQSVGKQVVIDPHRKATDPNDTQSTIVVIGKDFTREGLMRVFQQGF